VIETLVHLKRTGMPLAAIAEFTRLIAVGVSTEREQLDTLLGHRAAVLDHRARIDDSLDVLERKIAARRSHSEAGDGTLRRADAVIAYTVHGSGPWLFLVGAPSGRAGFAGLARALSSRFTVVTHDPRGIADSALDQDAAEPNPTALADDLAALAAHLTDGPARFFGASGGAVTVLDLATRHPDLVSVGVLHEPPLVRVLGDPVLERQATAVFDIARDDPQRALQLFLDLTGAGYRTGRGHVPPAHSPLPQLPEQELEKNRYFLGRMAGPTMLYEPQLDRLHDVAVSVCAGEWSHGQLARRASQALADKLGTPLLDMPGNHLGPTTEAPAFAAALVIQLA